MLPLPVLPPGAFSSFIIAASIDGVGGMRPCQ
jgi:hypothetical protein